MDKISTDPAKYLVAHRGDRDGGPENTLAAFKYAVRAGARFAECDIQFTSDLVPIVLHDHWLKRLCHRPDAKTIETDLSNIEQICSEHFELLRLEELLLWLQDQPQLTMFIEIKPTILQKLTAPAIAERLAEFMPVTLLEQIVLISQSGSIIDACKKHFNCRIGWVAEGHHRPQSHIDYVFMPYSDSDAIPSWHARDVKVGLYTVNEPERIAELIERGADLIETDLYARMLRSDE